MDIPYEILKYIFSFQEKWWLIKNKLINIEKLHQIFQHKIIKETFFLYSFKLPISFNKFYRYTVNILPWGFYVHLIDEILEKEFGWKSLNKKEWYKYYEGHYKKI